MSEWLSSQELHHTTNYSQEILHGLLLKLAGTGVDGRSMVTKNDYQFPSYT